MKKILSLFVASSLIVAALSGCAFMSRKNSLDELANAYTAENYYEDQQKEVEALIAEYTERINASSDKDEIKKLEEEALEKINAVYTKDHIESLKSDAEEVMALVKGKILPYQQVRELLPKVKELSTSDNYAELDTAVTSLKALLDDASEKMVYQYDFNDVKFDVEAVYSEEEGIPTITLNFKDDVNSLGIKNDSQEYFQVSLSTICHTSVLNPSVDRMLSYNGMLFNDAVVAFCGDDGQFYVQSPEKARCEQDGNSYKLHLMTPEMKEVLDSDSETFVNSDNVETNRDNGDEDPINYVSVLVSNPSNFNQGNNFAERLTWIVIL